MQAVLIILHLTWMMGITLVLIILIVVLTGIILVRVLTVIGSPHQEISLAQIWDSVLLLYGTFQYVVRMRREFHPP